jgi:hypothetical protein
MPLKLKKYDSITGLNSNHALFSKIQNFILFDTTIKDLKTNQVYTSTSTTTDVNDPLGLNARIFDATGDSISPNISVPASSTVLLVYRQYGNNSLGGSDSSMFGLFSGDMFQIDSGNWSGYDYKLWLRGSFGSVYTTDYKVYRDGLDWNTQQPEITALRQQANCLAVDFNSGDASIYHNGVKRNPTVPTTVSITPSTNPISVQLSKTVGAGKEFILAGVVVFNTVLTDLEKESVTQEPWEMTDGTPPSEVALTGELKPSNLITAQLTNFQTIPTQVVLTDSNANTITLPLTDIGSNQVTFTIPDLPSSGLTDYILFGNITLTFGTKVISGSFEVKDTQTLTLLADPVDSYVFSDWTTLPVGGDQLVVNTSDGSFDSNGNWSGNSEGTFPIWCVYKVSGSIYRDDVGTSQSTGFTADLGLSSISVESKVLVSDFGVNFTTDLPVTSLNITAKTLVFDTSYSFIANLNKLTITPVSKLLQFSVFKAIPLDSNRIYYIK